MFDWTGDTFPCVVDYTIGEIHEAHFFVTTLGDSSYPFVEAISDEIQMHWNQGHIDAFEWYGDLPRILVPDNCKTTVVELNNFDGIYYRQKAARIGDNAYKFVYDLLIVK